MANFLLDQYNYAYSETRLENQSGSWNSGEGFLVLNQLSGDCQGALSIWSVNTGIDSGATMKGVVGRAVEPVLGVGVEGQSLEADTGPDPRVHYHGPGSGTGVRGVSGSGVGVHARAPQGTGLWAQSDQGIGAFGETFSTGSPGVWGVNHFSQDHAGRNVQGGKYGVIGSIGVDEVPSLEQSAGVLGSASAAFAKKETFKKYTIYGVIGKSPDGGVWGEGATSGVVGTSAAGSGVNGTSATGPGVQGASVTATGVAGIAGKDGHGVTGASNVTTKFGVFGINDGGMGVGGKSNAGIGVVGGSVRGIGLYAVGAAAAVFDGNVLFRGNVTIASGFSLQVQSMAKKHGIVKLPDGSERLLCAIESPEAWLEDFGEASLVKGKARVALDQLFLQSVNPNGYHVFLTPYGETAGLYVARRTTSGFDVAERKPGGSSVRFSWRIVARPKGEKKKRFAKSSSGRDLARINDVLSRNGGDQRNALAILNSDDIEKAGGAPASLLKPSLPRGQSLKRPKLPSSDAKPGSARRKT